MSTHEQIQNLLHHAALSNQGIAMWFLPGETQIQIIIADERSILQFNRLEDIPTSKGFFFAPFHCDDNFPAVFLPAQKYFRDFQQLPKTDHPKSSAPLFSGAKPEAKSTSKNEYLESFGVVMQEIKNGRVEKVVLSRIKNVKSDASKHTGEIFLGLKKAYPDAFCYLFYTPQTGLWMGATPETLLSAQNNLLKTMALAGTRKHMAEIPISPWPQKEIQEQQFVTDFIRNEFRKLGIKNLQISTPYTSQAGSIEHIKTDFVVNLDENNTSIFRIIKALHPTPAVCGMPKDAAMEVITKAEHHQREYYTGFLGPLNIDGRMELFVNLRCMKLAKQAYTLFIGGGITKDSNAEDEWQETEMKSAILEKVLTTINTKK